MDANVDISDIGPGLLYEWGMYQRPQLHCIVYIVTFDHWKLSSRLIIKHQTGKRPSTDRTMTGFLRLRTSMTLSIASMRTLLWEAKNGWKSRMVAYVERVHLDPGFDFRFGTLPCQLPRKCKYRPLHGKITLFNIQYFKRCQTLQCISIHKIS